MNSGAGALAAACVACLVLVWIMVEDLRRYRIRNVAVAMLVACFALKAASDYGPSILAQHAILAGVGFALGAACFALNAMGGGDVKLLSAALLWVGPEGTVVFASILLVSTLLYTGAALCGIAPARRIGSRLAIPFGPSICSAWLGFVGFALWR